MNFSWLYQSVLIVFCLTYVSCQCAFTPISCKGMPPIVFEKCCNTSRVPINSVEIDYFVTQTDNSEERWRLDATVRWQAPTEDDAYTYSVDFSPTVTLEDLALSRKEAIQNDNTCNEKTIYNRDRCPRTPYNSTVTGEETANFTSILFGFSYNLQIQMIHNGVIFAEYTCSFRCLEENPKLQAPDCLIATGDIEFCQNQPIPVSTEPRDVKVNWTMESRSVTVHITWSMPLVVNGKLMGYDIAAYRLTTEFADRILFTDEINGTEIQITSKTPGISNGGFLTGYSYDILVTPLIDLPVQYRSHWGPYEGNSATRRINISTIDKTTEKTTQTDTKGADPSTKSQEESSDIRLIVLLSSSIFAVLVAIVFVVL